ncbi:MAG TPA: histidine phosphatase family protein [Acidimicrobiales bacterium]|nr:histidine phosphatase family protein [Acidimicrobiales bacterium]
MRFLTIVRHCKSSPAPEGGSDFDRPLNRRGREQAEQLREWARDPEQLGQYGPTTALVSAAARTRETFRRAFDETPFVVRHEYSDLIYNGRREVSPEDLLIDLAAIDPVTMSLLVVAHNPTVHELVFALATKVPKVLREGNYPLGGAFVLALPDNRQVGLMNYDVVASFVPD